MDNEVNQASLRAQSEARTAQRSRMLGLKYLDSRNFHHLELLKGVVDPRDMHRLQAIPLVLENGQLTFAVASNSSQKNMRQLVGEFPNYNVGFVLISEEGFNDLMLRHDPPKQIHYEDIVIASEGASETLERVSQILEGVKSDDIMQYIIEQAFNLGASDIHFECEREYVRMRLRVHGTLHVVAQISHQKYQQVSAEIAIRADIGTEAPKAQTGHLVQDIVQEDGQPMVLNMRIETVPTNYGQDAVIRLLNMDESLLNLDNLGMYAHQQAVVDDIVRRPHGLVMMVGPTGSGKTTTLYSIINRLNSPQRKIITLEDPVEYGFHGISQIPISSRSGDTFAEGLRAVLRLDPDVVMVGEIRDVDTAKTALQSALTGHLVLSTFHATDAAAALSRMLDMIGESPLMTASIRLIAAQRLVRRLDDETKEPYKPDERILADIKKAVETLPDGIKKPDLSDVTLYRPVPSEQNPLGYTGRVILLEQLEMTSTIRELLRKDPSKLSTDEIREAANKDGMVSMFQDGVLKALQGLTNIEELYRVL